MADWDSAQYLKFNKERTQPSIDLANRIPLLKPKKIIDIGCGPGNSTKVLFDKYPNANILGVDYSENMLDKASENYPMIKFSAFDASSDTWNLDNDYDIVFSNACIQWIPNHNELLRKMMNLLNDGGILAVQIPIQYNEPIYEIMKKVVSSQNQENRFSYSNPLNILNDSEYYDILSEISKDFEIWTTTYYHRMKNHRDIVEWYKSTALKPYLDRLDEAEQKVFLEDVYREVLTQYKTQANGEIILRFPRLFFIGKK